MASFSSTRMYLGANPSKNKSEEPRKKLLKETGIKINMYTVIYSHFMRPLLRKRLVCNCTGGQSFNLARGQQSQGTIRHSQSPDLNPIADLWRKKCVQARRQAWLICASSVEGKGPKFQQLIVSCL